MFVLTVVAPSNDYTIYFNRPLPKPNYIRLISCSLYNSWHNLKRDCDISLFNDQNKPNTVMPFQGHYTLKTLAKNLENVFDGLGSQLQVEMKQPVGQMVIQNLDNKRNSSWS